MPLRPVTPQEGEGGVSAHREPFGGGAVLAAG
jgi:hypothetical protein